MDGSNIGGFDEADLVALATVTGLELDPLRDELRRKPWRLHDLLSDPATAEAVLEADAIDFAATTPRVFFGVIVHQAAEDLASAAWIAEWTGPRRRLPVFDVESLVEFAQRPTRLLYLTQLLVSFTAPTPLPIPVSVSPFDLAGLVEWLEAVEPDDRPAMLQRLGDVALFMAGVCADKNGSTPLTPLAAEHLGGSIGMDPAQLLELVDAGSMSPGLDALERLGAGWYAAAAVLPTCNVPGLALDFARQIRPARRFLNHLADRYLNPIALGFGLAG